jgi:hypothetical protein
MAPTIVPNTICCGVRTKARRVRPAMASVPVTKLAHDQGWAARARTPA